MIKQHFNFEEIFSFAWSKTKQHAWFLVCAFMIYAVIMSAVKNAPVLGAITALLVSLSLISMSLIIVRNDSFSFADLFNKLKSPRLVINFFALTIIYVAAVSLFVVPFVAAMSLTAGTVLYSGFTAVNSKLLTVFLTTFIMLLPGIWLTIRFKFYPYVLIENEHLSITDVIKHTEKLTRGIFWQLFGFFIALSLLNVLGALAFGFGLIFTVPVSIFAVAHLYRKLAGHIH